MIADIYPPIELDPSHSYGLGLLNFYTYNSICNISRYNRNFYINENGTLYPIEFKRGTYNVEDIFDHIKKEVDLMKKAKSRPEWDINFKIDSITNRVQFKATFDVDFTPSDTIGKLLGFTIKDVLPKNVDHVAPSPGNIFSYHTINVECNLITDSYLNSSHCTILHSFCPQVELQYRISHSPSPVVYLRLSKQIIDNIQVRVTDHDGSLLDFQDEQITVVLHLLRLQ